MESNGKEMKDCCRIGDRSTSDVVVRLRTQDGRDDWLYCHSHVLIEKSKYFADRLSENWPTCQIIDSRNCVEVYCQDSNFDYHVTVLRLLYVVMDDSSSEMWHGVRNALGILQVAVELGCALIIRACVEYLEAVPWEEAEEEEILRIIPGMGSQAELILSRLQPVNPTAIVQIFLSAIQFATSSPPPAMHDLKSSAQEQLEYLLTEDDDAPLLTADDNIKFVILVKLEALKEFVNWWVEMSETILMAVEQASPVEILDTKVKVMEVAAKVLEAIGYGTVILATAKRLHMVKVWLPFVRTLKPLIDSLSTNDEDSLVLKMDGELWQSMESSFVSIILALPSGNQAEILTEWLGNKHVRYPDLTEAFEVWCYRSKVAKRRLTTLKGNYGMANTL